MTPLKLSKYADDDGKLVDAVDAEFLRRKITPETSLEFTDITAVSPAFLDALLTGESPESIADRATGMSVAVDAAFAQWADRSSRPVTPIEAPRKRPIVRLPRQSGPPAPLERPPTTDDRYTPTRLVDRLRQALRGYIESAYPLADPMLVRARRVLLETEASGHLLAQEPFIETTTRYALSAKGYADLGMPEHVARLLETLSRTRLGSAAAGDDRTVLFPRFYGHQEEAFQAFLADHRDVVVATGTGSGKTECFLVPTLGALYDEALTRADSFALPGVRALILYPMNALVNDQLARLRLLFGDPSVASAFRDTGGRLPRFGMYTGRTPYAGPRSAARDGERVAPLLEYYLGMEPELEARLRQLGRYPAKDLRAFFAKKEERRATYQSGKRAGKDYTQHNWDRRLQTCEEDRELLTRHEMVHGVGTLPGHSPDVLVTNYSMLEYMLMRPFERPIFDETKRWLQQDGSALILVLDEAHMYRGAKGAEVAFLLRRLRARLGIHDRPDKLRVIATSASLAGDANALENVRRFAADLTGKTPDGFQAITGTREMPSPAAPATPDETELFASLDLDAINNALTAASLRESLRPVLERYGHDTASDQISDVLAALHHALAGRPFVNQVVCSAAGNAKSLSSLAADVFPGHSKATRALEGLLTLGTLARLKPDSPGLVPTRVHAMFRGLHGLYACMNPRCSGRQVEPGADGVVGKLFSVPRTRCDACGGRVFELASCRSCGSGYVIAYAESGTLDRLAFLWGETEGNLIRIQLLPSKPRYQQQAHELRTHVLTGFVERNSHFPDAVVRSLYLSVDGNGAVEPSFSRCAMCQPSPQAKARIFDFRTRGEQPFTALIEAQFAEQPPQKPDPRLPNHGRKVLVFSDGRQKAARLAPALEHSHARDLFRQVLALASNELRSHDESLTGMHWLYPGVVWLCGNRGYDLFPSADEVEFHGHLRRVKGKSIQEAIQLSNRGALRSTRSFAQALFSELTDRYYSLPSLALGTVDDSPDMGHIFDDFPPVGLDPEAARALFRAWIRLHLERRSFKPDGAELADLGEGWANPVGINANRMTHVMPNRFDEYVQRVLGDDRTAADQVAAWFQRVVRSSDLLEFEGDVYYLRPLGLSMTLRLEGAWFRCVDCGRIHPESLGDVCPGCLGELKEADAHYLDARTGFYRDHVRRAFDPNQLEPFGLLAAEHSAQLTGKPDESAFNKVEEYELRFQDIPLDGKPPIDILSCTTTMEVGIDIGALSGVALRNVPPHVANYQQRAGRAGRRGRSIASVVTYAHGTSHDAHFFDHPESMICGAVRAPIVYVENQQVLARHIHAYLLQRFFHDRVPTDTKSNAYVLFESLGTVEQFLSEAHPCSLLKLEQWLSDNAKTLGDELTRWVPTFSFGLGEDIPDAPRTIAAASQNLRDHVRRVLPVDEYARRDELTGIAKEALERRLEESLLEALIGHAVLPRYAFPTDVVTFWVSKPRRPGDPLGKRAFDYEPQRDLQLALTEYAPGRSLTIDKWRFESAALFSPYEPSPAPTLARRQPYTACRACSFVSLDDAAANLTLCPCCGSDQVVHAHFITPAGFAPDINERREVDRGQAISYAGSTDRARLEVQDPQGDWHHEAYAGRLRLWTGPRMLTVVNKGIGDRGFRVCPDCGRSEPEFGPGFTQTKLVRAGAPVQHQNPMEQRTICTGIADGPFYLGHRFPTDALLLRLKVSSPVTLGTLTTPGLLSRAARMALTSLVEAIALAATRELQIDEGEVSGWWAPVLGARPDEAQLYLYDLLPGGAGYARAVGGAIDEVLAATERLLDGCDCAASCYRCIRHYGNNYIHSSLDRLLARDLLRHVRHGAVPSVSTEQRAPALRGLGEYLRIRGTAIEEDVPLEGARVPLIVRLPGREVWVDVHHPLVDPASHISPVAAVARGQFREIVQLDAFTLTHDLPTAVARLRLPDGQP